MSSRHGIVLLLCLTAIPASAESKPVELRWSELAAVVGGQSVEFTTPQGVKIRGDVVSVRPDEMVLEVKKTSNASQIPAGGATIARTSIDSLKMIRSRGRWGRGVGTTLGVISGVAIGGYAAAKGADTGGQGVAIFAGVAGGMTVVGNWIGRAADRRVTTIRIVGQ